MKIVLTGAFVYQGKHHKAGAVLELPDVVAVEAIDDGAAEQAFDVVGVVPGNSGETPPELP